MKLTNQDAEKLIEEYVDCIIYEYIKAGGKEEDADRNFTYWALRGIYDREGSEALQEYIKNWKPPMPKQVYMRAYA